jgi:hypothetical protein
MKYLLLSKQELDRITKTSEEEAIKIALGISSQPPPPIPEFELPEDKAKNAESLSSWIDDVMEREERDAFPEEGRDSSTEGDKKRRQIDDFYAGEEVQDKDLADGLSDEEKEKECRGMKDNYNVIIGVSWGTLPYDLQDKWRAMRCDAFFM